MSRSSKRRNAKREENSFVIIPQTGYEGRHVFKASALACAAGVSLAAVLGSVPVTVAEAKTVTIKEPMVAYTAEISETKTSYSDNTFLTLQIPELEETTKVIEAYFEGEKESGIDLSKCTTKVSTEEAQARLDETKRQKEEEEKKKAAAAAKKVAATVSSGSSSYVRLNYDGIPMSEMTAPDWLTLDENGVPTDYAYCITGKGTAYYSGTTTATGTRVRQGSVAVDPREIPYGTEMWITSADGSIVYGYCRAEDTGGFASWSGGATVDLYMHSYDDCVKWGWRGVKVYILN
jgi:3D (Asp-Asp-Asp) domain-containing protein/ribosomal protein L14E/L6E/L27E